jgi:hypothetical protein
VLEGLATIDPSATGSYEISGHFHHQHNPYVIADIRWLLKTSVDANRRPGRWAAQHDGVLVDRAAGARDAR